MAQKKLAKRTHGHQRVRKIRTRARYGQRRLKRISRTATLGGLFLSFLKIGLTGFGGGFAVLLATASLAAPVLAADQPATTAQVPDKIGPHTHQLHGIVKGTPASGWLHAYTIARGEPHPLNAAFTLERFSRGETIDEKGAGPTPWMH